MIASSGLASAAVDRCLAVSSIPGVKYATLPPPLPLVRVQGHNYVERGHVERGGERRADRWTSSTKVQLSSQKLAANEARLTFIGHSTFQIESADGVRIATDYNDYVRPVAVPDIATMNRAHSSHYTDFPSPAIKHVLRGWNPEGGPVHHDVEYKDVHVRNISTNTRWGDTAGSYGAYGNSIFIFQLAGLCIGHLGHLHHTLTPDQLMAIGQLDVVLVPVDGGYTLDVAGMVDVMQTLRARLIVPMHYFNQFTLNRFLDRVKGEWPIDTATTSSIVISQKTMPAEARILILPGQ